MTVSFAVHAYNEADALRRLVLSSLPLAGRFDEWVVVDHRSTDHTQAVLDELAPVLAGHDVRLARSYESRDFSAAFTFAHLRTATLKACSNAVVAIMDADFLLGPAFEGLLDRASKALLGTGSAFYGAGFAVPVVWDRLVVDQGGTLREHGRVWVHHRRPRIVLRDLVHYEQTKQLGRWERLVVRGARKRALDLGGPTAPVRDAVVSVNVKPAERLKLRQTMTLFLQDAMLGKVSGTWLENYERGTARSQPAYEYRDISLAGWLVHGGALELPT